MSTSTMRYAQIQPRLLRCHGGGWLAVSEFGSPLNIGLVGPTPEEARQRFAKALEAWLTLLQDEPDVERV